MLVVNSRISIPLSELQFTYVRSSGPGGQNVNKVSSKAVLTWDVVRSPSLPDDVRARLMDQARNRISKRGELILSSERYRDRERNHDDCLERLREIVARAAVRPKVRRPTKPTRASKERRLKEKRARAEKKSLRREI